MVKRMPTPDGIHRFLKKRGVPVSKVLRDVEGEGFIVIVKGKANEAVEFLGNSAEEMPFTIEELNDSRLGIILWRIRLQVRKWLKKS